MWTRQCPPLRASSAPWSRVLALAAPRVGESRVLILATLRTGEPLPSVRRRAVAAMLRAARRLPVVPLDDEAAGQVADAAAPRALGGRVRREVVARAHGYPLFLRELAILASADPRRATGIASLPETVRSVLERRLDSVDTTTRAELTQLAVCGDDLAVEWARRAAQEAAAGFAHAAAADWYRRALDAQAADPSAADRLELLLRCGEALEASGDPSRIAPVLCGGISHRARSARCEGHGHRRDRAGRRQWL